MIKDHKTVKSVEKMGDVLVELFHLTGLFLILGVITWAAFAEFFNIVARGQATLSDILLLFIYLELGAMIGIYFRTHKLPVRFLIYIAITALTRHLTVDMKSMSDYAIFTATGSILILTLAVLVLKFTQKKYGIIEKRTI